MRDRPSRHRYLVTVGHLVERWSLRRDEFRRFASLVDGGRLCEEVLADLRRLDAAGDEAVLTLSQAALCSGYSREHLGRMLRQGKIPNAGRLNAPKIRLRDMPLKAGYLPQGGVEGQIGIASKRQIVRSIVDIEGSSR